MDINQETLELIKSSLQKTGTTAGISTTTGLNFYYLEQVAKNIYPVFYPVMATMQRVNPMFNGQRVGGTGVNWKAITAINSGGYPALSEGNRNAFMSITEQDYYAPFKWMGYDGKTTFQAQMTGLGFDDNIGLTQLSLLNGLLNDEERMILFGNSGPSSKGGNNGFALGTCPTPTATLATGGSIPASQYVSAYCVALTCWGATQASTTGVQTPFTRNNADGSTDVINGGTSAVSAGSNIVETTGTTLSVTFAVTPVLGAVAYAWYVCSQATSGQSAATAYFYSTTSVSTVTVTSLPSTSNQNAAATGLATDASYNNLDFDGLLTWTFNYAGSSQPSYVKDLAGAQLTANGDGTIAEFETLLDFLWQNYKITPDAIYCGGNVIDAVTKAILTGGGSQNAQRIFFTMDQAGKVSGGTKVAEYRSKYSNKPSAKSLPVSVHPWLPGGTIFFDLVNNPYPAAGNSIPAVRRVVSLEDHFSIKWPYVKLAHELGVYCFETIENYIPFGFGVLTGVGPSTTA